MLAIQANLTGPHPHELDEKSLRDFFDEGLEKPNATLILCRGLNQISDNLIALVAENFLREETNNGARVENRT